LLSEANIDQTPLRRARLPRGKLPELLAKSLLYEEVETHWKQVCLILNESHYDPSFLYFISHLSQPEAAINRSLCSDHTNVTSNQKRRSARLQVLSHRSKTQALKIEEKVLVIKKWLMVGAVGSLLHNHDISLCTVFTLITNGQ
jgi:hypothetical protein